MQATTTTAPTTAAPTAPVMRSTSPAAEHAAQSTLFRAKLDATTTLQRSRRAAGGGSASRGLFFPLLLTMPEAQSEPPDAFCCPIGLHILEDPVMLIQTGHTFERAHIEAHLAKYSRCPLSGVDVTDCTLVPNHALRKAIDAYRAEPEASVDGVQCPESREPAGARAVAGVDVPEGGRGDASAARLPAERDYSDPEAKRVRAIEKRLKTAIQLREDKANGKKLNVDQEAKITAIPEMEKELAELEAWLCHSAGRPWLRQRRRR